MKRIKAMTFKDVLASVKKKQEEFESLPEEEQKRIQAEQQKAIEEFYANGGTAMGFGIGSKK